MATYGVEGGVGRSNQNRPLRMSVMNETTTDATKAKTAKHLSDAFGLPKYEMPKMEVPAEFREMTDQGVAHARDIYAKALVASEEAPDLLENTYTTFATGPPHYNPTL